MWAGSYKMNKWLNIEKDQNHILDTKWKKKKIKENLNLKGPIFNVFPATLAFWLTLLIK